MNSGKNKLTPFEGDSFVTCKLVCLTRQLPNSSLNLDLTLNLCKFEHHIYTLEVFFNTCVYFKVVDIAFSVCVVVTLR